MFDLSTSANVDVAGARMFLTLERELEKQGITLRLGWKRRCNASIA
ncbi:MAG TPA: hypothetical protein VH207_10515 [Chthoniobacterales bacterium]|nr:hypothetical protein [Chthoniobacterales bacterium]